jgi:hypothetical protein
MKRVELLPLDPAACASITSHVVRPPQLRPPALGTEEVGSSGAVAKQTSPQSPNRGKPPASSPEDDGPWRTAAVGGQIRGVWRTYES